MRGLTGSPGFRFEPYAGTALLGHEHHLLVSSANRGWRSFHAIPGQVAQARSWSSLWAGIEQPGRPFVRGGTRLTVLRGAYAARA